jgi:hypothetical protein
MPGERRGFGLIDISLHVLNKRSFREYLILEQGCCLTSRCWTAGQALICIGFVFLVTFWLAAVPAFGVHLNSETAVTT